MKPDPWALELAARRIGMSPAHCLYVGDALTDGVAAAAAGMQFAAVSAKPGRLGEFVDQGIATVYAETMADLLPLLKPGVEAYR